MMQQQNPDDAHQLPPDWLCRLAAHDGYGARAEWQCLCPGQDRGEEPADNG